MRKRILDRSAAGFVDQSTNSFSAAATARSTSCVSLSATCEYGFPVAGSMLSMYFPPTGSTNLPSMKLSILGDSLSTYQKSKRRTPNVQPSFAEATARQAPNIECVFYLCGDSFRRVIGSDENNCRS